MFDIVMRTLNIVLCTVGIYYALRRGGDRDRTLRRVFAFVLLFFVASNVIAILYTFTKLPVYHLLASYPSTMVPMLLIANLLLSIQLVEKGKLEIRARKLSALQNIGTKASSTLDLMQVAKLTLDEILQISKLDGLALYLASKQKEYLELVWSVGLFKETSADISVISGVELLRELNKTETKLVDMCGILNAVDPKICDEMRAAGVSHAYAIHLQAQQEPLGVMILAGRGEIELSPDEKDFIANAATWLSIAVSNAGLYGDLRTAYLKIAISFSKTIEAKDAYTSGHSDNVAKLSAELASYIGLPKHEIEKAYLGGRLHDIGKIGIPGSILGKPGSLTDEEYSIVKEHTYKGFEILQPINSLMRISDIALHHHERYDGNGYPIGLKGEKIPLLARIAAIADAYDAMISDRPYRKGLPNDKAIEIIEQNKGTQFDPILAAHFIEMINDKIQVNDSFLVTDEELRALFDGEFSSDDRAVG